MQKSCAPLALASLSLVALACGLALSPAPARADRLELVRYTDLWTGSPVRSSDASGVTYLPERGRLLIADSEISEYGKAADPATGRRIFEGYNVFEASLDLSARLGAHLASPADTDRREPVGIVYNSADGHVYVTDDDQKRIYRYPFERGHRFGDPVASALTSFDGPVASALTSFDGRYTDPEGITCDPATGELFVCSGTREERVLVFRFDAAADTFTFVRDFPVDDHLRDPEGIGLDPGTGHLFLVSAEGIAEFARDGAFVQFFDFGFLEGTGVTFTLPGGLTFAPSSDPNDPVETHSLYVTCRGVDNGAFPEKNSLDGGLAELRLVRPRTVGRALRVPEEHATIQAAVDAAAHGDTILVAPGVYVGPVDLGSKRLTLISRHYQSADEEDVARTIIDGEGGDFALRIDGPGEGEPAQGVARPLVWGFTIRNANDGITATAPFDLVHCRVTETTDGLDYEGGGGTVRFCRFDHNRDDAVDLDGDTAALIEYCDLVDNGDDGIEIRLHPHGGPDTLDIVIRRNLIARNGEDGVQLIGYDEETARRFRIHGNRIVANAMAGIGMMPGANTREDYTGAPLPEQIVVANNTFADNEQHLVGGARVLVANNILTGARVVAVSRVGGKSRILRNLVWGNTRDGTGGNWKGRDALKADPRFAGPGHTLAAGSPAIDAGLDRATWGGREWPLVSPAEYSGRAPDLGAVEWWVGL